PFAYHVGVILQFGQNVPVALKEHGALLREEGRAGGSLGKIVLVGAPVILLQADVEFHALAGARVQEVAAGLVRRQDAAARLIHKIPVAKLVIGIGHVAVVAGGIVDFFRGFHKVVPGPGLVRVSNAGSIEHFLVIYQAHGVLVLRHTVQHAIGTACIGQRNVREMLGLHNVGAVCQFAVVGIFQDLVGMHPENIRHLVGHGGSFQLGPVFVPVDDLHFN